ncbi:MAG TPA: transposase, partial [Chthonomonadaceae bacterium]|nr:transposase [Chthonomonadaceae bacterium]
KNREPLVTSVIERRVYAIVEKIFRDNGCPLLAINGMPDHVHVLTVLSTTITIADLIGRAKGGSSRIIGEEVTPDSWFAWQPNYGAFSVSASHVKRVVGYIANQKVHHTAGTVWEEAEETDEPDE